MQLYGQHTKTQEPDRMESPAFDSVCAEIIVLCWLIRKDAIMLNKESTFGYAEDSPIHDCS